MESKSDQALAAIERLIVFEDLQPGTLVSEAQLMERTGFGRTPVREALQRLARERMVEIHPNRGVLVPPSSIEAQLKLLELRRVLEPFATSLAAARATDAQRSAALELRNRMRSGEVTQPHEFADVLRDAHELIVDATHNEFLSVAMAPLQGLSRRFWFAHLTDPAAEIARASRLHGQIQAAIAGGDPDAASAASIKLNDYLVKFAYATLPRPGRETIRS